MPLHCSTPLELNSAVDCVIDLTIDCTIGCTMEFTIFILHKTTILKFV
jgi:hypothetical protein